MGAGSMEGVGTTAGEGRVMKYETRVSGCIWWERIGSCVHKPDGTYTCRNPITGQGWGIPTDHVEPQDLRAMADHLERVRNVITPELRQDSADTA